MDEDDLVLGLTIPRLHMNGTSRAELVGQYEGAYRAVSDAFHTVQKAGPNSRDYYVIGPDAYKAAANEHRERLIKLQSVMKELATIYTSLCDQTGGR